MKQKYSFLASGLLMLSFVLWMMIASMPAAVGMIGDMLLENLHVGFRLGAYGNYVLLGLSELLLLAPLVVYMRIVRLPVRALLGNRTSVAQNALAAALGVVVAVAVTGLSVAWSSIFTELLHAKLPDTSSYDPKTWPQLIAAAVALGACAGIAEEPVFRGVVLRSLGGVTTKWPAILWTALIFSLVHMDIVGAPTRFVVGVVLGLLAWRSGALLPGMFAHAAYNTTAMGLNLVLTTTKLADWKGFPFLQGLPQAGNDILTWCIISLPFILAAVGIYQAFRMATPDSAAWRDKPYVRQPIRGVHWLSWAGAAFVTLALTAMSLLSMFLPQLSNLLPQFGG